LKINILTTKRLRTPKGVLNLVPFPFCAGSEFI
jgi:hypothetical protein